MLRDQILLVPSWISFSLKNWRDLDFYEQKFQETEKFHVRKVKCLVRATERKMSVWRMETSDHRDFLACEQQTYFRERSDDRKYVCCLQATHLLLLHTNVKDKDKPEDRQKAVLKIKCCDCQATYIGETGRNLSTRLTERKRATRNGDVNNHIADHHLQTKHQIDWDSVTCITYSQTTINDPL